MQRLARFAVLTTLAVAAASIVAPARAGTPTPAWLKVVNNFRAEAGLAPVRENTTWSAGDVEAARYIVRTDTIGHYQDPASPYYTPQGDAAARTSDLVSSQDAGATDQWAIQSWIQAPIHALLILSPRLRRVGFGSFRDPGSPDLKMAAAINVLDGRGSIPTSTKFPVRWPGPGTKTPIVKFWGEWPDPLTACPGYSAPTGPPILLQLPTQPKVLHTSFSADGKQLEHCAFDAKTYTNPDPQSYQLTWGWLHDSRAVVLMPKQRLTPGTRYTVGIRTNGVQHRWSFTVADLSAQGTAVQAVAGAEFRGPVATLTDDYPLLQREDLKVRIDWGDGTETSGGIGRTGDGRFNVTGRHTYENPGTYTLRVTIEDVYSRHAATSPLAAVLPAALGPRPA